MSEKSRFIAALLTFCFGFAGIHRFYVNKTGTGIIWLLTGGIFMIGWLVDLVLVILGEFTDKSGKKLEAWFVIKDPEGKTTGYLV